MKARIQKVTTSRQSSFTFRDKSSPRFPFSWHFHPEYELTLIVESRGTRFVGDRVERYDDGDLVLIGPNLPHTWFSEPHDDEPRRHKAVVVQFGHTFLGSGFFERPELAEVARLLDRSSQGLRFTGRTRELAAGELLALRKLGGLDRLLGLLRVLEILSDGRGTHSLSSPTFTPTLDKTRQRRIDRVLGFINERYTTSITQPEAAAVVHMSPAVFSRFFKRTVGRTFVEYVGDMRVSHACRLLIETDLPIVDVCFRSGFNNLSNFNRRFLKIRNVGPREFRRRHTH